MVFQCFFLKSEWKTDFVELLISSSLSSGFSFKVGNLDVIAMFGLTLDRFVDVVDISLIPVFYLPIFHLTSGVFDVEAADNCI